MDHDPVAIYGVNPRLNGELPCACGTIRLKVHVGVECWDHALAVPFHDVRLNMNDERPWVTLRRRLDHLHCGTARL